MIEKLLAAATLLLCIVLMVRLSIGAKRRHRLDSTARKAWAAARGRAAYLWYWRASRRRAALAAEEAIRRAQAKMERDGNVYRPDAFREPRKPH